MYHDKKSKLGEVRVIPPSIRSRLQANAAIEQAAWQTMLAETNELMQNMITVESHHV